MMADCIKNRQTKNHFAHDQKRLKDLLRSRNGCTVTSNDTFQMSHIPVNKISRSK